MIISRRQMHNLDERNAEQFLADLKMAVREDFPEVASELSDEELTAFCKESIFKARKYSFETYYEIVSYIHCAISLGRDFDESGKYPWATIILYEIDMPNDARIEKLFEFLTEELKK